jgi:hypothetical protein
MLDLRLRDEFRGKRLKGTTVDFTNTSKTGALEVPAAEFLKITYPSFDLLKTIEATAPAHSRPVALMGSRGQGKSHLLVALYHLCIDGQTRLDVELLGLDHPLLVSYMTRFRSLPPREFAVRVRSSDKRHGVLSLWHVATQGERGEIRTAVMPLAVDHKGQRIPSWEHQIDSLFNLRSTAAKNESRGELLTKIIEPMIQRELLHRGAIGDYRGYEARLIGWVEVE